MYQNQQNQIPVSYQQVDTSCFSNTLPNNDRVPQLQIPRSFNGNVGWVNFATGLFRARFQNKAQSTPLHTVAYNLISSNGFQNQVYQQWCQKTIDLLGINMMNYGFNEQMADQVAQEVGTAFLGLVWHQYKQQLSGLVNQSLWSSFDAATNSWQMLENKLNQAKAQAQQPMGNMQMGQQMGNMQMSQGHNAYSHAVTGQANLGTYVPAQGQGTNAPNVSSEGMYTMQPAESFDSSNGLNGAVNMQNNPFTNYPSSTPTSGEYFVDEPTAPVNYIPVADIVVDPKRYDTNSTFNSDKGYDYIKVDDNTFIVPTFKSEDTIIRSGEYPLPSFYDPHKFMSFTITYSNGSSYEKIVEITPEMDYLKHELDDEMKRRYRIKGKNDTIVVPRSNLIQEYNGHTSNSSVDIGISIKIDQDKFDFKKGLPLYVIDDMIFSGSSDMEIEKYVTDHIVEKLENDFNVIPPHEYQSRVFHYLDVDEEGFNIISSLTSCANLASVGSTLKEALRTDKINYRTFNFVNDRLTNAINEFIKDSLSDPSVNIDDFTTDIMDLLEYMEHGKSKAYIAMEKAVTKIVTRSVNAMELDDGYAIIDDYINLQTHWLFNDLSALNLTKGECAIVSSKTNASLLKILKDVSIRNRDNLPHARIRMITTDGVYLELVRGHLLEGVNLLKRL